MSDQYVIRVLSILSCVIRVMSHVGFLDSPNVRRVMSDARSPLPCTVSQSALHEPMSQCVYSQDRNSGLVVPKVVPTIPTDCGLP